VLTWPQGNAWLTQQLAQPSQCIVALPLFVARRVLEAPPPALREVAAALRYASWLVANIHIKAA
jgi:hypothetical protein